MGIAQLLAVLKARRKELFAVWGSVVLLALVVSLVLPRQYMASAEVVVEARSGDPLVVQPGQGVTTPGFLATQADIMASERVGAKAVAARALERGLILLTCGVNANVVRFLFPLTIEDAVFDEAMGIMEAALRHAAA